MSIKEEAFKFYRKIWNSPNQEKIHNVIGKLKSSTRGLGNKIYPSPVLGLLLYDQQSLKRLIKKSAIEEIEQWSEQERNLLFSVHEQIRYFNQQCLSPLSEKLPQAIDAVNPYKEYPYISQSIPADELLFTNFDTEEMIKSFHTHPAFNEALSNLPSTGRFHFDYNQIIWQLNEEIVNAGPGKESEWVKHYIETKWLENPNSVVFNHLGALLCLHNSLANLNQFIYQALFQENLIKIDRTHIIDYFWTTRGAGHSMWLMHIPFGLMYIFEVTDLIFVNTDEPDEKNRLGDRLCSIHTQITPGTETAPGILEMRIIDNNLSTYGRLLPHTTSAHISS